ncbi:MAG: deaminase [Thermoprotei archaeon]|nr:MAG: deaminase [Thermoprotei archaeon]RLE72276.1 MAG: deaminase [Thermoprotei archaeon]
MSEIIFSDRAPKPIGPYSQAVKCGRFIFGSGQIAIDPESGEIVGKNIEEQTERIMINIKGILESVGYSLEDIVKTTVFLKNIKDYSRFNRIYSKFFSKKFPARTTVGVASLPKNVLIEIDFIAYR